MYTVVLIKEQHRKTSFLSVFPFIKTSYWSLNKPDFALKSQLNAGCK